MPSPGVLNLLRRRTGFLALPGLLDWHEADRGTIQEAFGVAATAADDPVGIWQDLSGHGRDLTQGTAGSRPLLKFDELGGVAVLRFDGVDDFLAQSGLPLSQQWTRFLVFRKRSAPDATLRRIWGTGTANTNLYARSSVSATGLVYGSNQAAGQQALGGTAAQWQIVVQRWNGLTSCETWANGTALTSFDPSDTFAAQAVFALGADAAGALPGDVDFLSYGACLGTLPAFWINYGATYLTRRWPALPTAWSPI